MGQFVLKNAFLSVNGVDLSDHVRSLTLNYGAEIIEDTTMSNNSKTRLAGLKDWSVEVEFAQDFAAGKVDATLFPLVGADSTAIVIRPDAGVQSATNPTFSGNAVLETYPPLSGGVGELATTSVTFQGDGDLTRTAA